MSIALTRGIRVSVSTDYLPEQSMPREQRYVFTYTVRIINPVAHDGAAAQSALGDHGRQRADQRGARPRRGG